MESMTLREAADRAGLSVTTLRRYIRAGRLRAEKRPGRYGPEYFVSDGDLTEARIHGAPRFETVPEPLQRITRPQAPLSRTAIRELLPIGLYQELQMKHEQLLVQYGMVRASGLRTFDLQGEVEAGRREIEECRAEITRLRDRLSRETAVLRQKVRESDLELEGRALEIAALREKVRALELLTRNAVTTETIERQFASVMEQIRVVERLSDDREETIPAPRPWAAADSAGGADH